MGLKSLGDNRINGIMRLQKTDLTGPVTGRDKQGVGPMHQVQISEQICIYRFMGLTSGFIRAIFAFARAPGLGILSVTK